MFCICVLIIAAAAVYMVEAYIHTYYAIEYMHGTPLFFVLLAKYAAPVLFLLLCGLFLLPKEIFRKSGLVGFLVDTLCERPIIISAISKHTSTQRRIHHGN